MQKVIKIGAELNGFKNLSKLSIRALTDALNINYTS